MPQLLGHITYVVAARDADVRIRVRRSWILYSPQAGCSQAAIQRILKGYTQEYLSPVVGKNII